MRSKVESPVLPHSGLEYDALEYRQTMFKRLKSCKPLSERGGCVHTQTQEEEVQDLARFVFVTACGQKPLRH